MYALRAAVLAVVGVFVLTATGVRVGNHAAYVRVVVDFNGRVPVNQVEFDHLWTRTAALHIAHPGIATSTSGASGQGVRVALQPATQGLNIGLSFAARRFKYVSYAVDPRGNRLAIDLWKRTPPPRGGGFGYRMCLQIRSWHVSKGSVSVTGVERGVFEHMFRVVVRGSNGKVLGKRSVAHSGLWSTTVPYRAARRQAGRSKPSRYRRRTARSPVSMRHA